jgi:uncharacterized protein (DUF427 family)
MPATGYDERPDYRVDILARRNRVVARHGGRTLADTVTPLLVDEQDHGVVVYFPFSDVDFSQLADVDHTTHCPYKGDANHWRLVAGGDPVAWTYRAPHPQVARLVDHVAFYQNRVTVEIGVATPAVVGYGG